MSDIASLAAAVQHLAAAFRGAALSPPEIVVSSEDQHRIRALASVHMMAATERAGADTICGIVVRTAENPQWTPEEIARFRGERRPPLIPNRLSRNVE